MFTKNSFAVTLTFQPSLQWCAIKPKFGCKRISSSEEIVWQKVIFWLNEPSLWPWPWRQQTILFALVQQFKRYHSHKHSLTFWSFAMTLTLNKVILSLFFFTRPPAYNAIKPSLVAKRINNSKHIVGTVIFWSYEPSANLFFFFFLHDTPAHIWCKGTGANVRYDSRNSHILIIWPFAVTLKIANHFLWFFSHYTLTHIDASSYKVWLVAQKILFRQIFIDILKFPCDFDHLVQKTPAYNKIPQNQIWLQKD